VTWCLRPYRRCRSLGPSAEAKTSSFWSHFQHFEQATQRFFVSVTLCARLASIACLYSATRASQFPRLVLAARHVWCLAHLVVRMHPTSVLAPFYFVRVSRFPALGTVPEAHHSHVADNLQITLSQHNDEVYPCGSGPRGRGSCLRRGRTWT